jgi:hypothetical protein
MHRSVGELGEDVGDDASERVVGEADHHEF